MPYLSLDVLDNQITLYHGMCPDALSSIESNSIDTVITDTPYGLGDDPDIVSLLHDWLAGVDHDTGPGFMGETWDVIPSPRTWREVLRVLKPGGMNFVFGGARTVDLISVSLRIAGFQIRDRLSYFYDDSDEFAEFWESMSNNQKIAYLNLHETASGMDWVHGMGMPYGTRLDRVIEEVDAHRAMEWAGWATHLKPAHEPIIVAMKPRDGSFADNALKWGVAGYWIDGGRVKSGVPVPVFTHDKNRSNGNRVGIDTGGSNRTGEWSDKGHWPSNVIRDDSDTVTGMFPKTHQAGNKKDSYKDGVNRSVVGMGASLNKNPHNPDYHPSDDNSTARFFYCAKASRAERTHGGLVANKHRTVKPMALMRYLVRLSKTPTGGIILDPFSGSGTTLLAAVLEGRDAIGVEGEIDYCQITKDRIAEIDYFLLDKSQLALRRKKEKEKKEALEGGQLTIFDVGNS